MHCASDMRHMKNPTHPLDSANPKAMETNAMRVEPDRCHTRVNPQTWSQVKYQQSGFEWGETSHRRPHNTVRGPELAEVLNSRNAMSASQCISQV